MSRQPKLTHLSVCVSFYIAYYGDVMVGAVCCRYNL